MTGFKLFRRKPALQDGRKFQRYAASGSEVMIGGKSYPMADWCYGGLRMTGKTEHFLPEQMVAMTLRFKTGDRFMEVGHQGDILRTAENNVAVKFVDEPPPGVKRCFQQVLDFRAVQSRAGGRR